MATRLAGTFDFDVRKLSEGMHLTADEVHQYFKDGRRVSFVMERRIARELLQGELSSSEGAAWDVIDSDGNKWEVRSLTKQGMYFCPSYMVGKNRKYDEVGFLEKLNEIEGYAIADVLRFPNVPIWFVSKALVQSWHEAGELGAKTKTGRTRVLKLLEDARDANL